MPNPNATVDLQRSVPHFTLFGVHLDRLFGCATWRDGLDIEDPAQRKQFFYSLYREQLRQAGAQHVLHFELYNRDRLVYAIFFGTQHCKGADLMKQAIWKVAPFGDFEFHGTQSHQLTLGILNPDFGPLRQAIRREFSGKGWVRVQEIEEFVASDRTDYHTGQLKKGALKPLEEEGAIEVDPSSRKRKGTFPNGTRLLFV